MSARYAIQIKPGETKRFTPTMLLKSKSEKRGLPLPTSAQSRLKSSPSATPKTSFYSSSAKSVRRGEKAEEELHTKKHYCCRKTSKTNKNHPEEQRFDVLYNESDPSQRIVAVGLCTAEPTIREGKRTVESVAVPSMTILAPLGASQTTPATSFGEKKDEVVLKYRLKARKLSRSILRRWHSRLDLQEVDSIVDLSLCEAIRRYDASKGASFMTFLYFHLRGNLIRAVVGAVQSHGFATLEEEAVLGFDSTSERRERGPSVNEVTEALYGNERIRPDDVILKQELSKLSIEAFDVLDPLEKEVIDRIYFKGQQLLDIAQTLGYSRCHISRVKKRALSLLRHTLRKLVEFEEVKGSVKAKRAGLVAEVQQGEGKGGIRRRRPRSGGGRAFDSPDHRRAA
jgi:RNA polymerase sigma factor (sigma-70 family)